MHYCRKMAAMTSPPGVSSETKNPYERTLWVVAGVLLFGSCIALVGSHTIHMSHLQGWTDKPPLDVQIAQLLSTFAPGAFNGGIVLGGMAVAIRALRFDRRLDDPEGVATSSVVEADDSAPAGHALIASQAVDHTPYMRPQGAPQG